MDLSTRTVDRQFFINDDDEDEVIVKAKNTSVLINRLSILCLTTFYFGYCLVYISSLSQVTLIHVFGSQLAKAYVKGFLIGSLTLGAMVGSFISIFLLKHISRRKLTLALCILAVIVEGIIQTPNLAALFVMRVFQGILSGLFMALIPVYITQLAPKQITAKGIFGVFSTLFVIIGVMVAFSLNIIFIISQMYDEVRWRIIFAVNFISMLIVVFSIAFGFIPESPNSLIINGQQERAKLVIGMFHKKRFVQQVYQQKVRQIQKSKLPVQRNIDDDDKSCLKHFLTFELPMMQQLTGINALVSQMGFVATAYNTNFGQFVPVIMGIVQFIAAMYSMGCLAKTKRRTFVLYGNLGMGLCSLGMGILFIYIKEFPNGYWVVIALIFLYMTIHGGTLIPAVWLYVSEVAIGSTPQYSSITNWFMCSVTIIVFPIINEYYGYAPMFLTFGIISILLFVLNYFIMFETKQKTIEKINLEMRKTQF